MQVGSLVKLITIDTSLYMPKTGAKKKLPINSLGLILKKSSLDYSYQHWYLVLISKELFMCRYDALELAA